MSTLHRRFFRGFLSQSFGQVVTLLAQVLAVPIFIHTWGSNLYGEWILLFVIPGYLEISDFSFGTAAGSEMTMLATAGKRDEVRQVYHSTFLFVLCSCACVLAVMFFFVWFLPFPRWLGLHLIGDGEARIALQILVLQVLFAQLGSIYFSAYRAAGRFAVGSVSVNLLRLGEHAAMITAVLCHGGPIVVASAFLGTRLVGCLATGIHLHYIAPWLPLGIRDAKRKWIKALFLPSLAFNAFPIGLAMNLQGVLLVVNWLFGSGPAGKTVVVMVQTTRTLSRAVYQFSTAVTNTVWHELSQAFGAGDLELAKRLHRRACQIGLWASLVLASFLALSGTWLYRVWTRHAVQLDVGFYLLLLCVSVVAGLYTVSSSVPVSQNKHSKISIIFMLVMSMAVPLTWLGGKFVGVAGIGLGLLVVELTMAVFMFRASFSILEEQPAAFFAEVFTPPIGWLRGRIAERRPSPEASADTPQIEESIVDKDMLATGEEV